MADAQWTPRRALGAAVAVGTHAGSPANRHLQMSGIGGEWEAALDLVTHDPFEALAAGDVLLSCGPPQRAGRDRRHDPAVGRGAPHAGASAGQLGQPRSVPSGCATAAATPCRRLSRATSYRSLLTPSRLDHIQVVAVAAKPGLGVFPADRTSEALAELGRLLPEARAHRHVLAAALASVPADSYARPALLMNATLAERPHPGRTLFDDGFTPGVARVAEALDRERQALAAALGLDLPTAAESLHTWGLSPRGDLWAVVNGSYALSRTPMAASLCPSGSPTTSRSVCAPGSSWRTSSTCRCRSCGRS